MRAGVSELNFVLFCSDMSGMNTGVFTSFCLSFCLIYMGIYAEMREHFNKEDYHRYKMEQAQYERDQTQFALESSLAQLFEMRQEVADFYGAVEFMDHHVGTVLEALDDASLTENTLVLFATDHGASFPHSKGTLYDGGTKVACMMRWPGHLPVGGSITT